MAYMARKFGFKPTLRQQVASVSRVLDFYDRRGDPNYAPEIEKANELAKLDESGEKLEAGFAPSRGVRAKPRQLEAPVVQAISELLAVHPRVLIALRMNSGAASYEAKTGTYAPVWFHKWLRYPEKMRMSDFLGIVVQERREDHKNGTGTCYISFPPLAIEAKAPGWTKPRDAREHEQAAFLAFIRSCGGIGIFATSAEQVAEALK